jgi:integrase
MATVYKRGGKGNRGGYYYVSWNDHTGRRLTRCTRTTDKGAAERIGAKLESDAALRRDGVVDSQLEAVCAESRRSIELHLKDYEAKLGTAGRDPKHIRSTLTYIRAVAVAAGFEAAADINADGVNTFANDLKTNGKSARTIQAYLTAIKSFTKWLFTHHKLLRDPLVSITKPNPKADRRYERRMLLPEEWDWLGKTVSENGELYGMAGDERAMLYATAIQTGLRANELRSLTRGRLFMANEPPYITCKAGSTKNKQDARLYIQRDLADALSRHVGRKSPKATVFAMPPEAEELVAALRADLKAARKAWLKAARHDPEEHERREQSDFLVDVNHESEVLDFHSLRHTCGAWLAMSGVHPKVVQTVMRHSSITLTMDTYGHLFPGQEADAVGRLPSMLSGPIVALLATGTDDQAADPPESAQRQAQRACGKTGLKLASGGETEEAAEGETGDKEDSPNVLPVNALGDGRQPVASAGESKIASAPRRTRTFDPLIKSQLLYRLS